MTLKGQFIELDRRIQPLMEELGKYAEDSPQYQALWQVVRPLLDEQAEVARVMEESTEEKARLDRSLGEEMRSRKKELDLCPKDSPAYADIESCWWRVMIEYYDAVSRLWAKHSSGLPPVPVSPAERDARYEWIQAESARLEKEMEQYPEDAPPYKDMDIQQAELQAELFQLFPFWLRDHAGGRLSPKPAVPPPPAVPAAYTTSFRRIVAVFLWFAAVFMLLVCRGLWIFDKSMGIFCFLILVFCIFMAVYFTMPPKSRFN